MMRTDWIVLEVISADKSEKEEKELYKKNSLQEFQNMWMNFFDKNDILFDNITNKWLYVFELYPIHLPIKENVIEFGQPYIVYFVKFIQWICGSTINGLEYKIEF